jgi:hypothetical protein
VCRKKLTTRDIPIFKRDNCGAQKAAVIFTQKKGNSKWSLAQVMEKIRHKN